MGCDSFFLEIEKKTKTRTFEKLKDQCIISNPDENHELLSKRNKNFLVTSNLNSSKSLD